MTRRKVQLEYINNLTQRKNAFKKRSGGLETKIKEIAILCDVEAAAVIYTAFEEKPVMLPDEETAVRVFTEFQNLPEVEKTKRMVTQKGYLEEEIKKMKKKKERIWRDLKERELENTMHDVLHDWNLERLHALKPEQVRDMMAIVNRVMHEVRVREVKLMEEATEEETTRVGLTGEGSSRAMEVEVEEAQQQPVAMEVVAEEPAAMVGGVMSSTRVSFLEETRRLFEQEYMQRPPQTQQEMMEEMFRQQRQRRMMMREQHNPVNEAPQQDERHWFTDILDPQAPPQMADLFQPAARAFMDDVGNVGATRWSILPPPPPPPGGFGGDNNNGGGNDAMEI